MMKLNRKYLLLLALCLPLSAAVVSHNSIAQSHRTRLPLQQQQHVLVKANTETHSRIETLSGIFLYPSKKGTYELRFQQPLHENGVLNVKNKAGKLVYQKPVSVASNQSVWRYNVGQLRPDIYLVEVRTTDTTYWTKFKVK